MNHKERSTKTQVAGVLWNTNTPLRCRLLCDWIWEVYGKERLLKKAVESVRYLIFQFPFVDMCGSLKYGLWLYEAPGRNRIPELWGRQRRKNRNLLEFGGPSLLALFWGIWNWLTAWLTTLDHMVLSEMRWTNKHTIKCKLLTKPREQPIIPNKSSVFCMKQTNNMLAEPCYTDAV